METGFVSFFSGALGLDLGLEQAGMRALAYNEIDKSALQVIRESKPGALVWDSDVRNLDGAKVVNEVGREVFAVVGGPPCQSFSTAGKRRGLSDPRGSALLHFIDLAIVIRPRFIVVENVRGLLSAPLLHRPHRERGDGFPDLRTEESPGGALKEVVARLEAEGYGVSFQLYNTANFGVPQLRERVVLIASSCGARVPHLVPTHSKEGDGGLNPWVTFRQAVRGLSEIGPCARLRPGREEFLRHISEGENWRALSRDMQKRALGGAFNSSGGRVGFCRRVAWDRPSPTLVTSPTMPVTELIHPTEMRPLSVNEYKRIQTFPDDWPLVGAVERQ
ncbi:MAG TPA: DNA cytosine methyltransferase, partial [Fimbriimonadaceae bacterium]|nr:DNA cytosine methyltransferase [Fimbriimonadaceae bacterium]